MKINTILYFISDAFKSLKRNKTISIASAATVLTTLLVFGAFLLTALNVKSGISDVQSKVEVKVFLLDAIEETDKVNLEDKLKSIPGVVEVAYETKDEALANFREQVGENQEILAGYDEENNPLPASYIVKIESPEYAAQIEKELIVSNGKDDAGKDVVEYMAGVESVGNDQELINAIDSFAKTINWVGIILFIVLIGVSLFLIINTIKITVYSRRREIGIMKFVGATDWFIRWPFIVEGIVIGVVGAILSTIVLYFGYNALYNMLTSNVSMVSVIRFIEPTYVLTTISWQFILAGVLIGTFGSIIALRKFLDV